MIIAVDFDGTLCSDRHPKIGLPNEELISYLRFKRALGDKVILWTCRTGTTLNEALSWCEEYDLQFDAVNANLPEMIQQFGNDCRKVFADIYIDDKAFKINYREDTQWNF